uniref:Uncharacterized protein n=1 Tax=Oryza punctata TaxID=4537 RepID=A0A0E0KD46_ORYPU
MAALEASGIGGLRQRWLNRRHPRQGASSVSRLRASGHPREEDYEDVQDVLAAEPVEAELQKAKVPPTTHFFITHARNPEWELSKQKSTGKWVASSCDKGELHMFF